MYSTNRAIDRLRREMRNRHSPIDPRRCSLSHGAGELLAALSISLVDSTQSNPWARVRGWHRERSLHRLLMEERYIIMHYRVCARARCLSNAGTNVTHCHDHCRDRRGATTSRDGSRVCTATTWCTLRVRSTCGYLPNVVVFTLHDREENGSGERDGTVRREA